MKFLIALSLLISPSAFACGSWKFEDLTAPELKISFQVSSVEIAESGNRSTRPLRAGNGMVSFQNGDQAHYEKAGITHWIRTNGKFVKSEVGQRNGLEFSVEKSGTVTIALSPIAGQKTWAVKVSDKDGTTLGKGRIDAFCGKSGKAVAEKEASRLIGYYLWRYLVNDPARTVI